MPDSLRKELHTRGLRYRLQVQLLNKPHGIADIIFPGTKVAVFVDGRFWHGRPEHASWQKIIRNFGAERSKPIELGTPTSTNVSTLRVGAFSASRAHVSKP